MDKHKKQSEPPPPKKSELSEKQKQTTSVAPSHTRTLPTPTVKQSIVVATISGHTVEHSAGSDNGELDSLVAVSGGGGEMDQLTGTHETDELDDILDELLA